MSAAEFDVTPLARSLNEQYGWDLAVWDRLGEWWFELNAALLGERIFARRSRIMERYYAKLFRQFGGSPAEISTAIESMRRFRFPGAEPQWMKDLTYVAICMNMAPGLAGSTIAEANRDSGEIDLSRYRHLAG